MDRNQLTAALAVIFDVATAMREPTEQQVDAAGAAALAVATQVIVDINRIANALEAIAINTQPGSRGAG